MLNKYQNQQSGFTLIEMIVSLGVFSIVVTMTIGAMLVLVSNNQQIQGEQSVMTNLAFAMDTMTREIRTGYNYYCVSAGDNSGANNIFNDAKEAETIVDEQTQSCPGGRGNDKQFQGLSFYEGGDSITGSVDKRILYYFDEDENTIMRRVGNGDAQSVVSSGLVIQDAQFYVTGTDDLSTGGDIEQPTVTIYIKAQEKGAATDKTYYLQTTVTQRTLDL
jgi:prepilin-type N-terminal cleavage/methylation domain-containing protein